MLGFYTIHEMEVEYTNLNVFCILLRMAKKWLSYEQNRYAPIVKLSGRDL